MDVLVHLAANPERVVSKEELLTVVWGGAFVEEGALAQAIHSLRKALGDDARQPRFIQTVPKRGYRLVAGVESVGEAARERDEEYPVTLPEIPSAPRWSWRARSVQAVAVLVVALTLGVLWIEREGAGHANPEANGGIRIIVLPFENLGKPEDPYFAAGLTEEITANLTFLPTMQVIPSRNALGDKGAAKPLSEIEDALKVDYVLVGVVDWRVGPRQVRVRPQLVRVADNTIVFGDPFEGSRDDLFTAQQELSRAVISVLGITLTPEQSQAVGARSTKNPDAYRAYVQGLVLQDQPFYSPKHLEKAAQMFEQAIYMDPSFAEAWAELSQVQSFVAFNTDPLPRRIEKARVALEHALKIGHDLPAVRLAQIYFSYRCQRNFDAALAQATFALQQSPNNPELLKMYALLLRRKGRLPEAIDIFQRALALDPQASDLVWIIAETHRAMRNHEEADRGFRQALSRSPDVPFFWEQRILNLRAWAGDPAEVRAILEESPVSQSPQLQAVAFQLDLDERKYRQALARLSPTWIRALPQEDQGRIGMLAVMARDRIGDHAGALTLAQANHSEIETWLKGHPQKPSLRACLAAALARLGRREEALAQAEQAARESRPDAFSGPRTLEIQAIVDAMLGRYREATLKLDQLLRLSYRYSITTRELRLNPVWDPLRAAPEFEGLLKNSES
jgi:adenylate cyclase